MYCTALQDTKPERAIGVVYRQDTGQYSSYLDATLVDHFDLVVHIDKTSAVEALPCTAPLGGGPEEGAGITKVEAPARGRWRRGG